jgi:hypothetical protein
MIQNADALEDFLGEEVIDREGTPVGTLACYWERHKRETLLLGVDIPGKSGHTHIVPAFGARCNHRKIYVEVAFTREKIIQAPSVTCEADIDGVLEERIWAYYGMPRSASATSDGGSRAEDAGRERLQRIFPSGSPRASSAKPPPQGPEASSQDTGATKTPDTPAD